MLRTRLLTAAVALPAVAWLIFYAPLPLFAGFIVAVTAIGLGEDAPIDTNDNADGRARNRRVEFHIMR